MSKHEIKLKNQIIPYEIIPSRRSRYLRLEMGRGGLRAIKPWLTPNIFVEHFIKTKAAWVIRSLAKTQEVKINLDIPEEEIPILKRRAAKIIIERLEFFNSMYGYKYQRLSIKDQKTRWGSCTHSGTLSFNCRLSLLPLNLLDYVVVHELCHLKEMNHSSKFWGLVSRAIPDHKQRRAELKEYNLS